EKHKWIDDKTFVELLGISQTLPGLNATNMAVLVGDRLRGAAGAISAICGICLPGAALMYAVAIAYHAHGDRPLATAGLKGVADGGPKGRGRSGGRPRPRHTRATRPQVALSCL